MRRLFEEIAEPAYGPYGDARRLELATQAVHVDLNRVCPDFLIPAVELLGELFLVHHAAAAQHQHFEHAQLSRREIERLAVEHRPAPGGVEAQGAVRQHRPAARMPTADQRAHACLQLGQLERLGGIVVGAQIEALDAVIQGIARSENQYRHARAAMAQPAQDLEAVELGQAQIEYHQVVFLRGEHVVRLPAFAEAVHGVIGVAQRTCEPVGQYGLVLDYEYAHDTAVSGKQLAMGLPPPPACRSPRLEPISYIGA